MEPFPSDPTPASDPPAGAPPVLPYRAPEKNEARWRMPLPAQLIFGILFFFGSVALVGVTAVGAGPLALVVFVGLILMAAYVHREWKWSAFTMGIFLSIGASILFVGICAVVNMR